MYIANQSQKGEEGNEDNEEEILTFLYTGNEEETLKHGTAEPCQGELGLHWENR